MKYSQNSSFIDRFDSQFLLPYAILIFFSFLFFPFFYHPILFIVFIYQELLQAVAA